MHYALHVAMRPTSCVPLILFGHWHNRERETENN